MHKRQNFFILDTLDPLWEIYFESLPSESKDIFYSPKLAKLYEETIYLGHKILCAIAIFDNNFIMYPFVKRNISTLVGKELPGEFYDATSIYGRGGCVSTNFNAEMYSFFYENLESYFHSNSIICAFDRFHPVLNNHIYVNKKTLVECLGGFIIVELEKDSENVYKNFKYSLVKDLRKAEKNNLKIFYDSSDEGIKIFKCLYQQTMNRKNADNFYYFSDKFYDLMPKKIEENFLIGFAELNGEILSTELVLRQGIFSHSFLGGTSEKGYELRANQALKFDLINKFINAGLKYYLLGGGIKNEDGIFKYKKAFSCNQEIKSYVGKTVYNPKKYLELKNFFINNEFKADFERFQFYDIN